jgi:hypothetical protein
VHRGVVTARRAGDPTVRDALRDAGHRFGNETIAAAVKARKLSGTAARDLRAAAGAARLHARAVLMMTSSSPSTPAVRRAHGGAGGVGRSVAPTARSLALGLLSAQGFGAAVGAHPFSRQDSLSRQVAIRA